MGYNSISEVKNLKEQLKSLETQVEELKMQLKSSQSKPQTRLENGFKREAEMEIKQEMVSLITQAISYFVKELELDKKIPIVYL